MKEEVLRLDRVTCISQGVRELDHFCLNVFAGEIMGLVPVNGTGLQALLRLLRQNVPIHYGYVYYRERLVNHWLRPDGSYNRVSIIGNRSGLAGGLTVSDNVFVLRSGFRKSIIQRSVLRRQLEPFLREIGVEVAADAYAQELTPFERFVVELVKAVVAGNRLVIISDASTVVSDAELSKLHEILRHYAAKGISFLYISQHYEEIRQLCGRAALMMNGQIAKVLSTQAVAPDAIHCFGVDSYDRMVRVQQAKRIPAQAAAPVLKLHELQHNAITGLTLTIAEGECVVLQDLDNHMLGDLTDVMTGEHKPRQGTISLSGKAFGPKNRRDIAVIQKLATKTMLFPELSYLDNLCFTLDHRLPKVWSSARGKKSIRNEYAAWLGPEVFDKHIDELTQTQQVDLIYARTLLQRPKVVFCVQPFMQADVAQRMHIWKLLEMLLDKRIAVVILSVNLADTLSLADRLVRIQGGRVEKTFLRSEFGALPESTPWRHLWNEQAP